MSPRKRKHDKRRSLVRSMGTLRYKKLFIVVTEGTKTEPEYFKLLKKKRNAAAGEDALIEVTCSGPKHGNSPRQVLKTMKDSLKKGTRIRDLDEAWLVVDKDNWSEDQLRELHDWSTQKANRGFALSNPNFEYWLLLHFEDGTKLASAKDCLNRLKQHLPNYDKGVGASDFRLDRVKDATERAKRQDKDWPDWPRSTGTTVYRLVERILDSSPNG
jgi:RloB-like protein